MQVISLLLTMTFANDPNVEQLIAVAQKGWDAWAKWKGNVYCKSSNSFYAKANDGRINDIPNEGVHSYYKMNDSVLLEYETIDRGTKAKTHGVFGINDDYSFSLLKNDRGEWVLSDLVQVRDAKMLRAISGIFESRFLVPSSIQPSEFPEFLRECTIKKIEMPSDANPLAKVTGTNRFARTTKNDEDIEVEMIFDSKNSWALTSFVTRTKRISTQTTVTFSSVASGGVFPPEKLTYTQTANGISKSTAQYRFSVENGKCKDSDFRIARYGMQEPKLVNKINVEGSSTFLVFSIIGSLLILGAISLQYWSGRRKRI